MESCDVFKSLRVYTGLNQTKFARKFSIPFRTYEKWEAGKRTPPLYVMKMMIVILEYEGYKGLKGLVIIDENE